MKILNTVIPLLSDMRAQLIKQHYVWPRSMQYIIYKYTEGKKFSNQLYWVFPEAIFLA